MIKKYIKIVLLVFLFVLPLKTFSMECFAEDNPNDKSGFYNGYEYSDTYYKKGTVPSFSLAEELNESIDPESGNLEVYNTDLFMKGKNGLDLKIGRYYSLSNANTKETRVSAVLKTDVVTRFSICGYYNLKVYEININGAPIYDSSRSKINEPFVDGRYFSSMTDSKLDEIYQKYLNNDYGSSKIDGDYLYILEYLPDNLQKAQLTLNQPYYDYETTPYDNTSNDKYFALGTGWAFDFPYIETRGQFDILHYGRTGSWKIKVTDNTTDSNLNEYLLKDIVIDPVKKAFDGVYSKYCITEKDGKKIYFAADGLILRIEDRIGNSIKFIHTTHTVDNTSYPLIDKIVDSLNRTIDFDYTKNSSNQITGITIVAESKKITYTKKKAIETDAISDITQSLDVNTKEKIKARIQSEFVLDNVVENVSENEGQKTTYNYVMKYSKESLLIKNLDHFNSPSSNDFGGTYNYIACLSNVVYPTGGKTVYEYNDGLKYTKFDFTKGFDSKSDNDTRFDGVIKNCGADGSMYYYRVIKRFEEAASIKSNERSFEYLKTDGHMYDGYQNYSDSDLFPDGFNYSSTIYYPNKEGMKYKQQYTYKYVNKNNVKQLYTDMLEESSEHKIRSRSYYSLPKRLLLKRFIRNADKDGHFTVSNEDFEYNDNRDLIGYWDNQALRKHDSVNDEYIKYNPEATSDRTNYTFYPKGNWNSDYTKYIDTISNTERPIDPDEFKTTYTYHPTYHYLTGKTYKKDNTTRIREEYIPTGTESDNPLEVQGGKVIRLSKVYEKKGTAAEVLKKKTEYKYDKYGNITNQLEYYTSTGSADLNSSTLCVTTKFDYTDNKSRSDFDGAYLNTKTIINVKDADNNLVEDRSGNKNGTVDEKFYYDWYGNLDKKQDANGYTTSYQYDLLGRLLKETNDIDSSFKQWEYTLSTTENYVTYTDENNTKITDPKKRYKTMSKYDAFGNKTYDKVFVKNENNEFDWVITKEYTYNEDMTLDVEHDLVKNSTIKYSYNNNRSLQSKLIKENESIVLHKESYEYDIYNNVFSKVTKTIMGDGGASKQIVSSTYTDVDNLLRIQERNHLTKFYKDTFEYDYLGNKTSEKTARAYDETWKNGENTLTKTSTCEYDFEGKLVQQTNAENKIMTITYDEIGRKISTTDMKGNSAATKYSTTFTYDNMGRVIVEKVPFEADSTTGSVISFMKKHTYYDRNSNIKGQKSFVNGSEYNLTKYGYDSQNRLNIVKKFEQKQSNGSFYIDDSSYGGKKNVTQYYYDSTGNKRRMYRGFSEYHKINGLDDVENIGNELDYSVTKYDYDGLGRLIKVTDPMLFEETYEYDLNNNLTSKIDKNKNTTTLDYDGLNRLKTKNSTSSQSESGISYTYTYALNGNRLKMIGEGQETSYKYDDLGRLISESDSLLSIEKTYSYNASNMLEVFELKQNGVTKLKTKYDYDRMDRLWHVYENDSTNAAATYVYDANGNRESLTYSNGSNTINSVSYKYNLANRLKTLTNMAGTTTLSNYNYTYYIDGNENTKNDSVTGKTTTYVYDGMNRLLSESEKTGTTTNKTISYTYNAFCDRDSMKINLNGVTIPITTTYQYDDNNRLKFETKTGTTDKIDTITEYFYDDNGNQTCKTVQTKTPTATGQIESFEAYIIQDSTNKDVTFYDYDVLNQLTTITTGQTKIFYTYNGDGLRISKDVNNTKTYYVWDAQNILIELDGQKNVIKKYLRGINLIAYDEGSTRKFYLFNGHGDVVQLTSSTGAKIKDYEYDAFGNEQNIDATDTNAFRYCGEYFDKETGTIYLRARNYDPAIGRFISQDSYPGKDNDPLSLNLYTYCANNPVMFIDPSGNFWMFVGAGIGAALNAGFEIAGQIASGNVKSLSDLDVGKIAIAAATGAAYGLVASSGIGLAATVAFNTTIAVTSSAANDIYDGKDRNEIVKNAAISGVTSFALGYGLGKIVPKVAHPRKFAINLENVSSTYASGTFEKVSKRAATKMMKEAMVGFAGSQVPQGAKKIWINIQERLNSNSSASSKSNKLYDFTKTPEEQGWFYKPGFGTTIQ